MVPMIKANVGEDSLRRGSRGVRQVLLDEAVAKADPASDPAKDLSLDLPFQKGVRASRKFVRPMETAVSDLLQQHEPPTVTQPQDQPPRSIQSSPTPSPLSRSLRKWRRCRLVEGQTRVG